MDTLMSDARFAEALARLDENKQLRLPLRRGDILGRLALRFLWRRQIKWQVESNIATRDALSAVQETTSARHNALNEKLADTVVETRAAVSGITDGFATEDLLRGEIDSLRRSDQHMMAGLNQRLYAAIGSVRSEISDLRLRLADKQEDAATVETRLATIERDLTTLTSAARDTALRHARLDLFLDKARATTTVDIAAMPERSDFLEFAVASLLDGPVEQTRARRAEHLPLIRDARAAGATGPALDMAPMRGEWLEVLRAAEIPFLAATLNKTAITQCAELGLTVVEDDAYAALVSAHRRSLGAVTAFRYAERQDPTQVAKFIDSVAVALQPGGVLVLETPMPGDGFHVDPFAVRPIHPTYARFLCEAAGFTKVEIREIPAAARAGVAHYCLIAWM
jgi:hypothetical protein